MKCYQWHSMGCTCRLLDMLAHAVLGSDACTGAVSCMLQVRDTWAVAGRLGEVPGSYIGAALVPAIIITVLFYFDHNVSSQMAQQPEVSQTLHLHHQRDGQQHFLCRQCSIHMS